MIYLLKPLKYKTLSDTLVTLLWTIFACTHANCTTITFFERAACSNCSMILTCTSHVLPTQFVSEPQASYGEPKMSASYGSRN